MKKGIYTRAPLSIGAVTMMVAAFAGIGACVSARDARNGVPNENQYLRKDFLTRTLDAKGNPMSDPGWFMKATVLRTSTPNWFGVDPIGIFPGAESAGGGFGNGLVRFRVTQDHLEVVSVREISTSSTDVARTQEVVNAWPVTNVDLKYRINLDGETTNFYEENQEAGWRDRQWVKINFAKNDMSDVAVLGPSTAYWFERCADAGSVVATLLPDGYVYDPKTNPDYFQFVVQISAPVRQGDATCDAAFHSTSSLGSGTSLGDTADRLGRYNVTFDLMYSFARANPQPTYKPLVIGEKDSIRHKYGPIEYISVNRDPDSGLLAAKQFVTRFDPTKPILWYFAEGFPAEYKNVFLAPGGIKDATNDLLQTAGVMARVDFKDYKEVPSGESPRVYGDVRYNFLRWISDLDTQDAFAGVTQFVIDPRTGETISASININDFAIKDAYIQRIDAFLNAIGATTDPKTSRTLSVNDADEWPTGSCNDGDTLPLSDDVNRKERIAKDSLFTKMQDYLQKPASTSGPRGPSDFIVQQPADFYDAYIKLAPFYVFADPATNPFVTPEGGSGVLGPGEIAKLLDKETEFHKLAAKIDRGEVPFQGGEGAAELQNATAFLNQWRDMTLNHLDLKYKMNFVNRGARRDVPSNFSFEQIIQKDARHCVNGQWETKAQWIHDFIYSYWSQVLWHEFGHALGLEHNFMASVDRNNYQHFMDKQGHDHVGMYASSVMEYNARPDRAFWGSASTGFSGGWGPYDKGAISFIYANDARNVKVCASQADCADQPGTTCDFNPETAGGAQGTAKECMPVTRSISGQISASYPWKDPYGFAADGSQETQFLFCSEAHLKYTPLCRQGDSGSTPSEIIANEIEMYEWQYQWTNFRQYRKIWSSANYADVPTEIMNDTRKFLSLWNYDWSSSELVDTLRRVGVKNPDPNGSDQDYFAQLTNKFNTEISSANQMVAAFHKAIIQQSAGERPYKTTYDPYFGDVNQQGIIVDKLLAMQGFVGIWPTQNYDQNQAGNYIASYSGVGDASYQTVAEDTVESMIGGQYDVYPYFPPLAVAQFAQDTHNPAFVGRLSVRDWIGGHVFHRFQDLLDFFRLTAVDKNVFGCTSLANCTYDPTTPRANPSDVHHSDTYNEFQGPDGRRWSWAYVADRNVWVAVDRDRNTASYVIVHQYNEDVVNQQDDGNYPNYAYTYQRPIKYFLDAFEQYN